jgi:hypothetical protein
MFACPRFSIELRIPVMRRNTSFSSPYNAASHVADQASYFSFSSLLSTHLTLRAAVTKAFKSVKNSADAVGLAFCTCQDFSSCNLRSSERASSSRALVRSIIVSPQ